jgi:signal transduction histidine kinase
LEELGLVGALQKLAHMYSARLSLTVSVDLQPVAPGIKTEHALLRIAQEALANAARHSNASLISLCLAPCAQGVTLTITDNGDGFEAQAVKERHGLGLQLMRERVQELHGTFALETAPGNGTSISITLPLEEVHD